MSNDEYLITDAPLKALTVFAMPMILGGFFQQVYNMADSIIVGQFVGSSALAAVGACAALTNVFICVALGAGVGAGVLVSRYFGARDYSKMKTIVSTSHRRPGLHHGLWHCQNAELCPRRHHHGGRLHFLLRHQLLRAACCGLHPGGYGGMYRAGHAHRGSGL